MNSEEIHQQAAIGLLAGVLESGVESVRLKVRGRCMEPLVADGDWVTVSPGEPRIGQVALARDPRGELVCHRVLGRGEGGFLLAGDRDLVVEDYPVAAVLGRVRSVHREGGGLGADRG